MVSRLEFEIDKFANGFKNTIDWMLKDTHAQEIKEDLQYFNDNKNKLEKDPDSTDALFMIISLVKTSGFRLKPRNFDTICVVPLQNARIAIFAMYAYILLQTLN
jgi:hypothetical protein